MKRSDDPDIVASFKLRCIDKNGVEYDQWADGAKSYVEAQEWVENSFRIMEVSNKVLSVKRVGDWREKDIQGNPYA